jgi:hypothetical protein
VGNTRLFVQGGDVAGAVSWIHLGDLHMTRAGEQNDRDLQAIVNEINAAFADSVSFVYLPGDVAEDGNGAAYAWCARRLIGCKHLGAPS